MKSKSLAYLVAFGLTTFAVPVTHVQLRGMSLGTKATDLPLPDPPGGGGFASVNDLPLPDPPGGGGFASVNDLPLPDPPGGGGFASVNDLPLPDPPGGGGFIG